MIADWPSHAACRNSTNVVPVEGVEPIVAKRVCRACPVRWECLADALDNRMEFGVWGGMTERERRALLRRHPTVGSWRRMFEAAMAEPTAAEQPTAPKTLMAVKDVSAELAAAELAVIDASLARSEFAACYATERPLLVRFLMKLGASAQDAFDAAQDAFVEALRCWERIQNPRAWLRTVAIRRLPRRRPEVPLREWQDLADPAPDVFEISDETSKVLDALRRLPPVQRLVMAWTMDGFEPVEIAAEVGMTPEAVRQARARARASLKRMFLGDDGGSREQG